LCFTSEQTIYIDSLILDRIERKYLQMTAPQTHYTCQFSGCSNRCSRKHKVAPIPVADVNSCYLSLLYSNYLYCHQSYFICETCQRDDDYHYYLCRKCGHVYCHDCCFK
jgi:hypothetical protein